MAHNSAELPWENLASKFHPEFAKVSNKKIIETPSTISIKLDDLPARPSCFNQSCGSSHHSPSVIAFAKRLGEQANADARRLRDSMSARCPPAQPDDIIISDSVARRITPSVQRYRMLQHNDSSNDSRHCLSQPPPQLGSAIPLCTHDIGLSCGCILPLPYRRYSAFCFDTKQTGMRIFPVETATLDPFFSQQIFSILMSQNEAVPVMRALASDRRIDCVGAGFPGCMVTFQRALYAALNPYIILNVLFVRPETWDPRFKRQTWHDYRDTSLYQNLVTEAKGGREPPRHGRCPSQYPHLDFFEIPERWWLMPFEMKKANLPPIRIRASQRLNFMARLPLGTMPYSNFAGNIAARRAEMPTRPSAFHPARTALLLRGQGLPREIIDMIMPLAGDDAWVFRVADDPLNARNRQALSEYLKRCWDSIVLTACLFAKEGTTDGVTNAIYTIIDRCKDARCV